MPVSYKVLNLDCAYRLDLLIEDIVIVEIKSIQQFESIHTAQLITYNINPATQYIEFRASRIFWIKAWLAGKGHSLGKSRNAEAEYS